MVANGVSCTENLYETQSFRNRIDESESTAWNRKENASVEFDCFIWLLEANVAISVTKSAARVGICFLEKHSKEESSGPALIRKQIGALEALSSGAVARMKYYSP